MHNQTGDLVNSTFTSRNEMRGKTMDIFTSLLEDDPVYQVYIAISDNRLKVLMALSLIGNALSLCAVRKRMRKSSSCFYIANLAVCDTCVIWSLGVSDLLREHTGLGTWSCKVMTYVYNASILSSVWLVVMMTTERLLAVVWPLRITVWVNISRARIAVAVNYLIWLITNSIYLLMVTSESATGGRYRCSLEPQYEHFFNKIWAVIDMSLYAFVSQTLVLFLNVIIITYIRRARRQQKHIREQQDSGEGSSQVTAMLLSVSITFLMLTCPYSIFYIGDRRGLWEDGASPRRYAIHSLIYTCFRVLAEFNHCVNFLLYVTTGKAFREELKTLFQCCGSDQKDGQLRGSNQTSSRSYRARCDPEADSSHCEQHSKPTV